MKILALETLDVSASVVLMEDMEVVREVTLTADQRSAQFLTPAVTGLLADAGWEPREVALVALPVGPGSFTGLRVGVTFAKTFAYVTGAAVLGLNTLDVLAESAPPEFRRVAAVMDAQRGDVITRTYVAENAENASAGACENAETPCFSRMKPWDDMRLADFDAWVAFLAREAETDGKIAVTGPILARKKAFLPRTVECVPEECWRITPVTVGRMARERFLAGQRDSLWDMLPIYARRSAAEERRLEKSASPGDS